jgi:two-component system sensor histidine kinase AlgZ
MVDAVRRPWFPDFCRLPRIAAVLAIAELVVLIIGLAPSQTPRWNAEEFVATSAFALWLGLTQAIVFCKARALIEPLPRTIGLFMAMLLTLLIAAFGAWAVHQIDHGLGTHYTLPESERWRFIGSIAGLSMLISALTLRYFYVSEQWRARLDAQAKAEVDALQARIRPHFLFNSMNTIASLVRSDPVTAERAVEDLSELFRAALGAGHGESSLAEEIHLAERYLAIEGLRLGQRLRIDWQVADDAPRDLRMPRLVLQPLLENAVVHGIAPLAEGGEISIRIATANRRLRVQVRNPAPAPRESDAGNRHAQDSIAQRLAYHFGVGTRMKRAYDAGYYVCEIELPLP